MFNDHLQEAYSMSVSKLLTSPASVPGNVTMWLYEACIASFLNRLQSNSFINELYLYVRFFE